MGIERQGDPACPLLLIGAGGHAKVVIDIARRDARFALIGLIDSLPIGTTVNGASVLGNDESLENFIRQGVRHVHVAIGDNVLRLRLAEQAEKLGFELASLISPAATLSSSVRIGNGTVIMSGAVVNADAAIGRLCIVNTTASVDHDCVVGAGVHLAPNSTLAGNVHVGDRCFIGAGATIIPRMILGHDVIVGAGACIIQDVPSKSTVVGVPARLVGG